MTASETVDEHELRHADFILTDEEQDLQRLFAGFFQRGCPIERVRAAEPHGFDRALWQQLIDMRIVAMGVPEARGGDGAGYIDLLLLTEQWGKSLAPVPLVEALVAARLMARVGGGAPDKWLGAAIDGSRLVTFAHHPAAAGLPQLVPFAPVADGVVALVGDDLVVAVPPPPEPVPNQGLMPLGWVDLAHEGVERTALASGDEARDAYAAAQRDWRLLMSGALAGMAQGALAIGIQHAKDRIAFGVPIGSFQAVAHPLVDVAMDAEVARRIALKAAWFTDFDPATERQLVPMAYLAAEEAAVRGATVSVHTLGGVGFTVEADAQLFFRRAKGWTLLAGDPQRELDAIADELFGPITVRDVA